ncbi:MAG: hypothetical protein RQ767_06770, partial [Thermovirgaceae bacterium]|nr:hypothetical protein [Thermovirgaceae bacterium]
TFCFFVFQPFSLKGQHRLSVELVLSQDSYWSDQNLNIVGPLHQDALVMSIKTYGSATCKEFGLLPGEFGCFSVNNIKQKRTHSTRN